jgi:hypothetical protein
MVNTMSLLQVTGPFIGSAREARGRGTWPLRSGSSAQAEGRPMDVRELDDEALAAGAVRR